MPSNHLILCCSLLLLPSVFPSIRVFSKKSVLHIRWPKYGSFSFSMSPSDEYLGLISFRMDLLDLLAVEGTLKSLLQQHSSKASSLQHSAILIVQLSHPYVDQNYNKVGLHTSQNGHHQKIYNNKCQRGCGKRVILLHCWWECTLIEPLWRAVRRFLKKLKTELSYIWPCIWPWTARRSNQSILKEINPEYSLEGPVLKLKL